MLSNVTSNTCHIFVAAGYKEITSADDPGSTPGLISSSCQPAVRSDDPRGGVGLIYPSSEQRRKDSQALLLFPSKPHEFIMQ